MQTNDSNRGPFKPGDDNVTCRQLRNEHIRLRLEKNRGEIVKTAKDVGYHRSTLPRIIEKEKIPYTVYPKEKAETLKC
jgi:ActR/RegA family two-component response regulator